MPTRALLATILLALPLTVQAAPKHHGHRPATVNTATFRVPAAHRPVRELRASRHSHTQVRVAATHHHGTSRGS